MICIDSGYKIIVMTPKHVKNLFDIFCHIIPLDKLHLRIKLNSTLLCQKGRPVNLPSQKFLSFKLSSIS